MSYNLPDPTLVTSPSQLKDLVARLKNEPIIAVDTESNSLFAYQEQVCLIQFSIPSGDYLVDPLALDDLSSLGGIFASRRHEVIFHAAEYDLICLKRDFDFHFANIFDTMIAARVLGIKKIGLASLLEAYFGIKVNKKYQRANWGKRPLPREQLTYAQLDTHYLIRLREILLEKLKQSEFLQLAKEDFARMCHVNGTEPPAKDEMCWRISGVRDLDDQQTAVLQALCLLREDIAEKLDRPSFKVLNNDALMRIACSQPGSFKELSDLKGVSPWFVRRFGSDALEAVEEGLQNEPVPYPRKPRPSDEYLNRMDALRTWRKVTARARGVESDIVLPRDLMETIVGENPDDMKTLAGILRDVPWRLEHFGEDILEVIRKA